MQLYRYTCRNILNTITTSEDTSLEKIYLSLYLKVLCVRRSWRLNKDCNILTSPAPPNIAVCLSRSPGLLNRRPGAQLSAGCCFLYSIISSTLLIPRLNRGSRGPLLLGAVFSTASFLQHSDLQNWLNFLCTELYNSSTLTQSLPITGQRNM